ncbi:MAG: TRAP transporter small permease [Candidatus Rokubacteria bacterium]|nr:TRAP transporter small permease [Candidatus Rokubacteria bacterium]
MSTAPRRALERLETALNLVSALILFALMFYVTAEIFMRYLFNHPLPGHLELTQLLIAPAVFLALSWVQARRGHVGMDLLHEKLSPRGRAAADCLTLTLALVTFAVITWFSSQSTWTAWEVGDVTPTANITTWWSRAAVPVGSALLCVRLVMQLVESLGILFGRRRA